MQQHETQRISRTIVVAAKKFECQAWFEAAGSDFPGQERAAFRHRMLTAIRCKSWAPTWSLTFKTLPLPIGHALTLEDLAYHHFRDQLGWPIDANDFISAASGNN